MTNNRNKVLLIIGILVLNITSFNPSFGDTSKKSCLNELSLEEFKAFGLLNNQIVSGIDREYANQIARAFEMEVLANPELAIEQTFTHMHIDGANDPQSNISLGQMLRFSDFGSKQKVAELIRKSGSNQQKISILELTQTLVLKYYKLYSLQSIQDLISNAEKRSAQKVKLVEQGVQKGLFSRGEEKLFEAEQYRLEAQKLGIAANILSLQQNIKKELNTKCLIRAKTPAKLKPIVSENELIKKANTNDLSPISRNKLLLKITTASQEMSRLNAYQIMPKLLYQHTNDGGDFFGAGFTIPLSFWNRNQGENIRLEAEKSQLKQQQLTYSEDGLNLQINNLRAAAENLKQQYELYKNKVVPSFNEALRAQEHLYAQGKGNILEVWQTLRLLNEAQNQELSMLLDAVAARIELSLFIGEEV